MKEQILTKPEVIDKLKKGSLWIGIVCVLAVLFNLAACMILFFRYRSPDVTDAVTQYTMIREFVTYGLSAAIMLLAALMFLHIAKDGMPFTVKRVRTVRIIGILFLLNAVIPTVVIGGVITPFSVTNYSSLIEGLLFLFIAHIIRYGAMLQQESDETL
ncbi:MAG: DUF2975 domain-containing protein [Oscillospiraceae bacterium]|nr:DUF2975 domain-containing protein [Oscillospiraceae bacterium]